MFSECSTPKVKVSYITSANTPSAFQGSFSIYNVLILGLLSSIFPDVVNKFLYQRAQSICQYVKVS
jgi:hypothetical protein